MSVFVWVHAVCVWVDTAWVDTCSVYVGGYMQCVCVGRYMQCVCGWIHVVCVGGYM